MVSSLTNSYTETSKELRALEVRGGPLLKNDFLKRLRLGERILSAIFIKIKEQACLTICGHLGKNTLVDFFMDPSILPNKPAHLSQV